MLLYYDYTQVVLCLVIVSCSPCPCNSEIHSQDEANALTYLEQLIDLYKIICLVLLFFLSYRATGVLLREKSLL